MITRRNLAEQLRDYQLRSERDWSSLSFWSSIRRADASSPRRWGIFVVLFILLAAAGVLYFKDPKLSLSFLAVGLGLLMCFRAIEGRIAKRRQRRILP